MRVKLLSFISIIMLCLTSFSASVQAKAVSDDLNQGIPDQISTIVNLINGLKNNISELQQTVDEQNSQINDLKLMVNQQDSQIRDLYSKINGNGQVPTHPDQPIVSGVVTDVYGTPVKGANIRLIDNGGYYPSLTDANGHYQINVRDPGTYLALVAEKGNQVAIKTNVNVVDLSTSINLAMIQGGVITGKVTNTSDPHASFDLYDQSGKLINKIFVNQDGSYLFNAPAGIYSLTLQANGQQINQLVNVTLDQTVTQNFAVPQ